MEDEIFVEIIRRIYKGNLKEEDYTYIKNYDIFVEEVKRFAKGFYEEGKEDERIKQQKTIEDKDKTIEDKDKQLAEMQRIINDLKKKK